MTTLELRPTRDTAAVGTVITEVGVGRGAETQGDDGDWGARMQSKCLGGYSQGRV